ncbi:hypothetical protein PsYK624_085450 [Phanerochaete sordida]|uniref:DUF6533 domain-containing protein n=1 Tax=Phanerochaete sordida TaxID=48140 RepID=A0A9P3GCJ1_9APHY|nr:hypothetical protein PsYK624_085450 [Phanerochaete sordida]
MSALAAFLAQTVQGVLTTRYSELASSVIIVYDHLVTLDQEVELIWKSGWSVGKTLFLLNRYYTLFTVIFNNYGAITCRAPEKLDSQTIRQYSSATSSLINASASFSACVPSAFRRCVSWFRWQGVSGIIAFTLSELILQLRLYALYGLNKKVMALMGSVFVATLVTSTVIMGLALARIEVSTLTLFSLSFCVPLNLAQITYFYAFWIPVMLCESLLCGLVILKAATGWKRKANLLDSGREIIAVLIRDSVIYFLVLFVVYLTNTIIFVGGDVIKTEAAVNYSVSMSCVMGSRLCLNVRGLVWHDDEIVITPQPVTLSLRTARSRGAVRSPSRGPAARSHASSRHRSQSRSRAGTRSARSHASDHAKWPVVVFAEPGGDLSEYEMDELRSMRVAREERAGPLALKVPGKGDSGWW